jgi:hypothetical protein
MSPSIRQTTDRSFRFIGIIAILVIAIFLVFKFVNTKITERRAIKENSLIFDKLRSTAKLAIWEHDFKLLKVNMMEKKYFGSNLLKFSKRGSATANGRIGFHIDLADTINTRFTITEKTVEIHAPLQLTYVSIDNGIIEQIKESSHDPLVEIDKEAIVKRLNEIALREQLKPSLVKAKKQSLSKQEKSLSTLTGRPVKIVLTDMPTLQNSIKWINRN